MRGGLFRKRKSRKIFRELSLAVNKDGTLDRMDTINDSQNIYTKATWEIKDGVLTTVVEGGPGKGTTVKGTVVSIDDKSQFVKMEAGAEVTKTRIKE